MNHPQDQQMRQILFELEMVSNGTISSYNSSGGSRGENPNPMPGGCKGAEYLYWRNRYGPPFAPSSKASAKTDVDRAQVIEGAAIELNRLRGHGIDRSKVVGETGDEFEARLIREGSGFTANEVALQFNCTPTRVRQVRRDHDMTVELGKPMTADPVTGLKTESRRRRALEYHQQGMTLKQISQLLGCDKATVSRDLRAA